jgi:hypothetical protein
MYDFGPKNSLPNFSVFNNCDDSSIFYFFLKVPIIEISSFFGCQVFNLKSIPKLTKALFNKQCIKFSI